MLYVQLDVNWPDHPKLLRAGLDGAGLHAIAMCIAKRLDSDGWMDELLLYRYGGTEELIGRLIELGLLEQGPVARVRPHDWHDRNPSQAAIAARRASKVRAAKAGNHKKHHHSGDPDECPICWPPEEQKPSVLVPAIAEARTPLADDLRHDRPETESESESEAAASGASDPATTPDQRQERLAAAAEIIGNRAARRPGVTNPGGCARAVANAVIRDRFHDAYAHLAVDPTMTAEQLADALEPSEPTQPERHLVLPPNSAPEHLADFGPRTLPQRDPELDELGRTQIATLRSRIPSHHHDPEDAA